MEEKEERQGLHSNEFAALCGVSKDTLLYYDRIGLFSPAIRQDNGYRLYSLDQVHRFDLLLMLRATGLPLQKIRERMKNCSPQEIIELLQDQAERLSEQIKQLQKLYRRLMATTEMVQQGVQASYDRPQIEEREEMLFMAVEASPEILSDRRLRMAMVRRHVKDCQQMGLSCDFLRSGVIRKEHLEQGKFRKDFFCVRTEDDRQREGLLRRPAGLYAVMNHKGNYKTLEDAYRRRITFIREQGLRIAGDGYEMELLGFATASDARDYVIQIAIQVAQSEK